MEQVAFGVMANQDPPAQNDPRRTEYERSQYSRRLTPDRSTTEMWSGVSRFLASWALHSHAQKVPDILGCPELQSVEKVQPIWAFSHLYGKSGAALLWGYNVQWSRQDLCAKLFAGSDWMKSAGLGKAPQQAFLQAPWGAKIASVYTLALLVVSCKREDIQQLLTLCIAFTTVSVCTQKFAQRVTPFWTPLKR